jgi:mitochondrial inner membrane protein COX18
MHQLLRSRASPLLLRISSTILPVSSHNKYEPQKRHVQSQAASGGIFQSFSESGFVHGAQAFLENVHSVTGLPWWASLCLSTFMVRTAVTLPLTIYQQKIFARLEKISEEMKELVPEMKKETAIAMKMYKWSDEEAKRTFVRSMKKQHDLRVVRDNCHPFKSTVVIWAQLPMWISLSMALRNMSAPPLGGDITSQITFLELSTGGCLWIPNLVLPDASWIFPVFLGMVNLTIIELQVANRKNRDEAPSRLQRYIMHFFRGVSVLMIPIAATVPSCMCYYWTMSSLCGLSHNLLLMAPKFRRLVNIPYTDKELQTPYRNIAQHFKKRLGL